MTLPVERQHVEDAVADRHDAGCDAARQAVVLPLPTLAGDEADAAQLDQVVEADLELRAAPSETKSSSGGVPCRRDNG